jgi:hypothetical protein
MLLSFQGAMVRAELFSLVPLTSLRAGTDTLDRLGQHVRLARSG